MWRFSTVPLGQPERSPREAEFFKDNDLPSSLVRETIQNSLDARSIDKKNIFVRFTFETHPRKNVDPYYKDLLDHLRSCEFENSYQAGNDIAFLLIEDFGTRGLDGPITRDIGGVESKSNYYNFWWREGISKKEGRAAGRWGLGKTVINLSSQLRSFWGLTVREDDKKELLLGKALLRTHNHGGQLYNYFSYFSDAQDSQPLTMGAELSEFKRRFKITRGITEPGLSLVIPLPKNTLTPESLIKSSIMHYFFPIMKNDLTVEIKNPDGIITLNSNTLSREAMKQNWEDTEWQNTPVERLMSFIEEVCNCSNDKVFDLLVLENQSKISAELFGDYLQTAKDLYAGNKLLAIRVPVKISSKKTNLLTSHFDIYMKKDDQLEKPNEFYVRAGITVSGIRLLRGNVHALLHAHDEHVSRFLGDSENPAHTDWKERTEDFQEKYNAATATLRFIRSSLREISKIVDIAPTQIDHDFLKDIFYLEEAEIGQTPDINPPPGPFTPIKPSPRIFSLTQRHGGFRVTLSEENIALPFIALLRVAYETRKGNSFSNYHPFDFNFEGDSIKTQVKSAKLVSATGNKINIIIENRDFELVAEGFDKNRDLVVDIRKVIA